MQLQFSHLIFVSIGKYLARLLNYISLLNAFFRKPLIRNTAEFCYESDLIQEYKKGLVRRNGCLTIVKDVLETLERIGDELPEGAKENFTQIRSSLNSWGDFRRFLIPSIADELAKFHPNHQISLEDTNSILAALKSWTEKLKATHLTLIRLQRYISVVALKISKTPSLGPLSIYAPPDISRVQQLNQEILTYEVLLKRNVVFSTPPNVQVEPTNRCNAKCKPCPHSSAGERTFSDFDSETLTKIPHVLSAAQFVEFLGLGEPSIAPSLEHLVSLCRNQGCETHIITNGTKLLQNPAFKSMKKIGISWDGDCKETFEAIRVGINFDSLIKSIRIFRAENPDIFLYFACTINRANVLQIPGMVTLAKNLDINAITFHRMSHHAPDLSEAVLKVEDIEIYRSKIDEGKLIVQGSNTLLFDYGILERLESEKEPLNQSRQLVTIKSYSPTKRTNAKPIAQTIKELTNVTLELYPSHPQLPPLTFKRNKTLQSIAHRKNVPASLNIERDLLTLEKRAAELKREVLAVGAAGLNLPHCTAAWSRLVLKADGRMFPCCNWSHDYSNLKEIEDFDTSWNGDFHLNLRDAFSGLKSLPNRCQNCVSSDKYQGLPEILKTIEGLGIHYGEIPKQPGFNPPIGKLQL